MKASSYKLKSRAAHCELGPIEIGLPAALKFQELNFKVPLFVSFFAFLPSVFYAFTVFLPGWPIHLHLRPSSLRTVPLHEVKSPEGKPLHVQNFHQYGDLKVCSWRTNVTFHHEMTRNVPSLLLQKQGILLQGCKNVDFEILVVTA